MTATSVANDPGDGTGSPFCGLEAAFDSVTRRHLARTGLGAGWDCWEVGAGSGSVARWLAERVGPSGSVLATDIDTSGMRAGHHGNLRVAEHDLLEEFPAGRFHCIHARLVLGHLSERDDLLARLASALVPGGWLVVEDLELVLPPLPEVASADQRLVHRVRSEFLRLLRELRGDSGWARGLTRRLRCLGQVDVRASAHVAGAVGGSPASAIERANLVHVIERLVAFGVATEDEVDRCLALLGDPDFRFVLPPLVSAWARRPPGAREDR